MDSQCPTLSLSVIFLAFSPVQFSMCVAMLVFLCGSWDLNSSPHSSKDSYPPSHEFPCIGKWACKPHFLYPALPEPELVKEVTGSTGMLMSFLPSFYHKDGFPMTSKQFIRYFRNRDISLYSGP